MAGAAAIFTVIFTHPIDLVKGKTNLKYFLIFLDRIPYINRLVFKFLKSMRRSVFLGVGNTLHLKMVCLASTVVSTLPA